jgi:hypothetical protein
MIQVAIMALILVGIYKVMDRNKPESNEPQIDWWMAFAFVLAPGFLIFLITIGILSAELSPTLLLAAYSLYFVVPFFYLKFMLDYTSKQSAKYAVWVPIVAIVVEVLFALVIGGGNA